MSPACASATVATRSDNVQITRRIFIEGILSRDMSGSGPPGTNDRAQGPGPKMGEILQTGRVHINTRPEIGPGSGTDAARAYSRDPANAAQVRLGAADGPYLRSSRA